MTLRGRLFLAVAVGAASLLAGIGVQAELRQRTLAAGEALFGLADALGEGRHVLTVNGLHFMVTSHFSERAPEALLDDMEARCLARDAGLAELLGAQLGAELRNVGTALRLDDGGQGLFACLELGEARWSARDLRQRLQSFAETSDLAVLGPVRLARMEPAGTGSHAVTVASVGALPLARAFPEAGDAPGRDPEGTPRPAGARRLLSAHVEGRASHVAVYTPASGATLSPREWRRAFVRRGFTIEEATTDADGRRWVALRDDQIVIAAVEGRGADATASVVVLDE